MAYRWHCPAIATPIGNVYSTFPIRRSAEKPRARDTISGMKKLLLSLHPLSLALIACQATAQQTGGDALTGVWVGEFGNGYFDRNTITLDLNGTGKI